MKGKEHKMNANETCININYSTYMKNKTKLKKRGRRENYTKLSTNEKRERGANDT